MSFTEFYCQTTGSNLNAGSSTADAAIFTFTNGNWDATTGIFIATGADLSAVTVGMFVSVYNDGATVAVFVGRITAVNDTTDTITVSLTAKSGTAPTTSVTGRSIKVGGAWKGPNAAEAFPFGFLQSTLTNAAGDTPRVNFKGGTNYAITATMLHSINGPAAFQGYTSTVGDGGRATIDGGTSGTSFILLNMNGTSIHILDLVFSNNGATGSAAGLNLSSGQLNVERCVIHDVRGAGINAAGGQTTLIECEAYNCNQSNAATTPGFLIAAQTTAIRCMSHDNSGSNTAGFRITGNGVIFAACIADTNGSHGFQVAGNAQNVLTACDSYNNAGDGLNLANTSAVNLQVESCNFIKNGGYGINGSGAGSRIGAVVKCGFGAGSQANTSGTTTGLKSMVETGSATYASGVTPWADPANGDFRIVLAAAKGAGRGSFTQTQASYSGTVGYPDIGAAQHADSPPVLVIEDD